MCSGFFFQGFKVVNGSRQGVDEIEGYIEFFGCFLYIYGFQEIDLKNVYLFFLFFWYVKGSSVMGIINDFVFVFQEYGQELFFDIVGCVGE